MKSSSKLENVEELTTTCKSMITFNQDGTYVNNDYVLDSNGNCIIDPTNTSSVLFLKINGNWYVLIIVFIVLITVKDK